MTDRGSGVEAATVFAVVPTLGQVEQTLRCLASLAAGDVVPTAVVVEHSSGDAAAKAIAAAAPDAVVLRGTERMWWAATTNVGVRYALAHGADYILTFNCDGVIDRGALRELLAFEHAAPGPVLVGAVQKFLHDPARVYNAGARFGGTRDTWFHIPDIGDRDHHRIDAIGCNCLLFPRACFDDVGLFDEAYLPQTWSDFDLQLRARAAGWSVYCVAGAVVWVDMSTCGLGVTPDTRLRRAAMLLTSWRSPYQVLHMTRFVLRHAPRRFALVSLARRYRPLVNTVVRGYLRPVKHALRRVRASLRGTAATR